MRLHYLQHVPFEDLDGIKDWADEKGHTVTGTHLYKNEAFPQLSDFDFLFVLGGPMGVYDEQEFPWLVEEKKFIEKAIAGDKVVIGLCLGAQLISTVLGGKVTKNNYKEIGWYPVILTEEAAESKIFSKFPKNFLAFHWHGDTFEIPKTCRWIASSEACKNQAFECGAKVIGLQFHLEYTLSSVKNLAKHCSCELVKDKYIATYDEMVKEEDNFKELNKLMYQFLNSVEELNK